MSRLTATYLLASIREMDVLGSYTPGCFALMMPTAGLADAIRVADRLSEQLLEHIFLAAGEQPALTLNVGVVQAIEIDDATSVLKRAEMALDAAERKRRQSGLLPRRRAHRAGRRDPGTGIGRLLRLTREPLITPARKCLT